MIHPPASLNQQPRISIRKLPAHRYPNNYTIHGIMHPAWLHSFVVLFDDYYQYRKVLIKTISCPLQYNNTILRQLHLMMLEGFVSSTRWQLILPWIWQRMRRQCRKDFSITVISSTVKASSQRTQMMVSSSVIK